MKNLVTILLIVVLSNMFIGIAFAEEKGFPYETIEIRQNLQAHKIAELEINIAIMIHKEKLRKAFKDTKLEHKLMILDMEHEKALRILCVKFEVKEFKIRAKYYKKSSLELLKAARKLGHLQGQSDTLSSMTLKGLLDCDLFIILDNIIDEKIKMLYEKYPQLKELDDAPEVKDAKHVFINGTHH